MKIHLKLSFLLPFPHLESNFSNFDNPQVCKFHGQCFLMPKKKKSAFVQGFKSPIFSVITKIKTQTRLKQCQISL